MSWRTIVISKNAKLDYQMGYMVVRGAETTKLHMNEIGTVIVESTAVSMTAYLLSELVKHKVKVIFCDEKRNPSSELLPYYGSHDTSAKIRKQCEWSADDKASVWTEIVSEKIRMQARVLEVYGRPEAHMLYEYVEQMECGNDHLGHGDSVNDSSELGYFSPEHGWENAVEDMYTLTKMMKHNYPNKPYFLLGHSMGSFLARAFVTKHGRNLTAAIFCGTSGGMEPSVRSGI